MAKRQQKRCRGESYSPETTKGQPKKPRTKARKVGPPCKENCRTKCTTFLSEEDRVNIFSLFWKLDDVQKQRLFIANHCTTAAIKRSWNREKVSGITRNRVTSRKYNLGGHIVCKDMFHNTLNVSEQYVKTCLLKADEGGVIHSNHGLMNKTGNHHLTVDQRDLIKDHIKSFPVMESHYLREQTNRQYLSSDLNVMKMYELYTHKYTNVLPNLPKEPSYRKIFLDNFNLGFHRPKKDQCSTCLTFINATAEERQKNAHAYEAHIANKNIARNLKGTYKEEALHSKK